MAMGSVGTIQDIPFLDFSNTQGKFLRTLTFFVKGQWRVWFYLGDGKYMESTAWPAEGCYFGDSPERASDLYLHFVDFIAQKASYLKASKAFLGLHDDVCNLSASLAKINHIHSTKSVIGHGDQRMIVAEVEYFFSVCRSMIDLFQEVVCEIWSNVVLHDGAVRKKPLRPTFSKMILREGRVITRDELQEKFGLPEAWADFYLRHVEFFLKIRRFRDNIIHHGSQVDHIFSGEDFYLVRSDFSPFRDIEIWRSADKGVNDLVPLIPALGMIAFKTLLVCEDFSTMLESNIQFSGPLVPGMRLYTRGYFDENFMAVLNDARERYVELSELKGDL